MKINICTLIVSSILGLGFWSSTLAANTIIHPSPLETEMLSDKAIEIQCDILASSTSFSYVTLLSNSELVLPEDTTADDLGAALSTELVSRLLNSEMFNFDTHLFQELIPLPNVEFYVALGVNISFVLLNTPNVAEELIEMEPNIDAQGIIVFDLAFARCHDRLLTHREVDHGGKDPAGKISGTTFTDI